MAPAMTASLLAKLVANQRPQPCPENWEHCDHCGALPNGTCRNPDVNEQQDSGPVMPTDYNLPPLPSVDFEAPSGDRPTLIGITGFKRSGKDTAAAVMSSILGYDLIQFAGPLKDMLRTLLRTQGIGEVTIEECVEGDMKETPAPCLMGKTPRLAMQTLGTEWGRETLGDTIWIETALRRASKSAVGSIITDVRFKNEADAIRAAGGVIVRVERAEVGLTSDHPSEQEILDIREDYRLQNHGTREDFEDKVAAITWRSFLKGNS